VISSTDRARCSDESTRRICQCKSKRTALGMVQLHGWDVIFMIIHDDWMTWDDCAMRWYHVICVRDRV
jgi:hypothetical protein